jgi:MFS family permease
MHSAPDPSSKGGPPSVEPRRLIWLVGLSHAANHFLMLIFPSVLLLIQQEFGLGFTALGVLANVGLLCYGLGALPAGILADRFGGERMLAIWLLGGAASCVLITAASHPLTLALGLAALGLFASLHHPAGSGLLVALRTVPGSNVGRAFGLVGLLGNVGLGTSPLISAAVGAAWGWRYSFLVGFAPAVWLGASLWRQPRFAAAPATEDGRPPRLRWRDVSLPLLLLFALETLMGFVFQGLSTFLPTHLAQHGGIAGLSAAQVTRGGILASVAYLLGGWGHAAAGRLMGLRRREIVFLATIVLTSVSLLGMGLSGGMLLVVSSVILSFTHFGLATMSNTLIASHAPPHLGGTAFGITFVLALGVGSMASGTMGVVAERWGLHAVFLALAAVAVAAIGLVALFARVTRARKPASATA